jgi:hypothetical protein
MKPKLATSTGSCDPKDQQDQKDLQDLVHPVLPYQSLSSGSRLVALIAYRASAIMSGTASRQRR